MNRNRDRLKEFLKEVGAFFGGVSAALWSVMSWQVPTMRRAFPSLLWNASACLRTKRTSPSGRTMRCSTWTRQSDGFVDRVFNEKMIFGMNQFEESLEGALPFLGSDAVNGECLVGQELEAPVSRSHSQCPT